MRATLRAHTNKQMCAGDSRFGGPIWWNTPMKDDDGEAVEEEYRTVWEQDGENAAGPSAGPAKRPRVAADDEDELPEDVQARLKALRGD
jgi:bud site selection protein 31